MKKIILSLVYLSVSLSFNRFCLALPVLNANAAINSSLTIYPDDTNPNLFYTVPQFMGLCRDEKGNPIFSYTEFSEGFLRPTDGVMMTTMCEREDLKLLNAAKDNIRAANPQAQFAPVPYLTSSVSFSNSVFEKLIKQNSCSHSAGVVGQEESCAVEFSQAGKDEFLRALRSGLGIVLQFQYTVQGCTKTPTGYTAYTQAVGVAARISKDDFSGHLEKYIGQGDQQDDDQN
jgi:hypothetical protein